MFSNDIIKLVEQVLIIKNNNFNNDTLDLEKKNDQFVYKIYNLTEEEIQIVESSID